MYRSSVLREGVEGCDALFGVGVEQAEHFAGELRIARAVGRHDSAVAHGLPLLIEGAPRVATSAPLLHHLGRIARVAHLVQEAVRRQKERGVADGAHREPKGQRLLHQRSDPLRLGALPPQSARQHQPGAAFGKPGGVVVGLDPHAAQRTDRTAVRGEVFHFVAAGRNLRAYSYPRAERRGEVCRFPVGEILQQDDDDFLFLHFVIYL